jgi:hypothetical protein
MNNLTLGFLISLAAWLSPAPQYSFGGATWYANGVMTANCQYRADMAGVTYEEWMGGAIDGVAMMSPADMGKTVWIDPGTGFEGPFRVCDAGVRGQVYEMVVWRGEVVEVGWDTAERWGMGPFDGGWKRPVEVFVGELPLLRDPLDNERLRAVDYIQWFKEMAEK